MNPKIMHHPDYNVTMCAGTSYISGKAKDKKPYMSKYDHTKVDEIKVAFDQAKLHPSRSDYSTTLALELMGQEGFNRKRAPTKDSLFEWWNSRDSHL